MCSQKNSTFQILNLMGAICLSVSPLVHNFTSITGNYFSLAFSTMFLFSCFVEKIGFYRFLTLLFPFLFMFVFLLMKLPSYIFIAGCLGLGLIIFCSPVRRKISLLECQKFYNFFLFSLRLFLAGIKFKYGLITVFCVSIISGLINSLYWSDATIVPLIYFLFALVLTLFLDKGQLTKFTNLMSTFHYWILLLAIVGWIYAMLFHDPILAFSNPDGRKNGLYLTTLSNTNISGFIRPSGIYDEPGTLSFVICLLVALREALSLDRRLTWKIIILGCITFSITHTIFLLIYLCWVNPKRTFLAGLLVFLGAFVLSPLFVNGFGLLGEVFLNRFTIVDGKLLGDNRTELSMNALHYLNAEVVIFGLNGDCIVRNLNCNIAQYLPYGENPATLMVHYGLTLSWAYYCLLLYLIYRSMRGDLMAFGVFLLLLQRPNLYSFGFAIMLVMYTFVLLNKFGSFGVRSSNLSNSSPGNT